MYLLKIVTLTWILCVGVSLAANIAFFGMSGSKSHKNVFRPMIAELSRRGHTVTMFTAFPKKDNNKGVREVVLTSGREVFKKGRETFLPGSGGMSISDFFGLLGEAAAQFCREAVETAEMKNMLSGKEKYDLVLLDHFFEDCGVAVAHQIKAPFMFVSTLGLFGQFAHNMRFPHPPVHVPFWNSDYTDKMNFWQRLNNLIMLMVGTYIRDCVYVPKIDSTLRSLFGNDLPSVLEMEKNASMILLNTHVVINHPAPYLPHTKEVGGMHLRKGNPLPKDLKEWVDGAGADGVIYFSLGTVLPASEMDDRYKNLFLQAFAKLPQRVVWKWETGEMEGLPPNVRVFKFLPQQDLLAYGKVRVFITHGGLLSLQETIFHGVPVIGIPGGADQHFNMAMVLSKKFGLKQTWETITSDSLLADLKTILYNPGFSDNVKKVSKIWKDQPQSPLEKAMFWVEFVIRHKGAPHLRAAVLDLKWYEYYMVDIAAFVVTIFTSVLLLVYFLLRFLYRSFYSKNSQDVKKKRA